MTLPIQLTTKSVSNDITVRAYSRRFHNIYLFITERCQLRCRHCYMGDRLERGLVMSYEKATQIISYCHRLGAEYLTFVGGEPTLHPDLPRMVEHATNTGYRKVMIDSNGLLVSRIKEIPSENLFYVRISLDGATAATHDKVRGKGNYDKAIAGIKELVASGYKVRMTTTIFQFNLHETPTILALADELGVELVNFHTFSEEGYGAANSDWSLAPEDWIQFYESLEKVKHNYKTAVRYPPTWVTKENLGYYVEKGYQGCIGCSLDRLSIFPDGRCYVCSLFFDEAVNFGFMTDAGLVLNKANNEYEMFVNATLKATTLSLSGCPAEEFLEKNRNKKIPSELASVCRLWRVEA